MKRMTTLTVLALVGALGACDEGTGPEGLNGVPVALSIATAASPVAAGQTAGFLPTARAQTYDDGSNALVVERVAFVVREIELERMFHDDCESGTGSFDDCEEFETGPYLLELPLDGSVEQTFSIEVPADTYDELEFEIHKPGDDPGEAEFVRANPDFDDVSIRVEGTWNGESFIFVQDLNVEQEIEFIDPLVIEEGADPINVTLTVDISGWFRAPNGDLIDPVTANKGGLNEDVVEDNIERSFEIFEDNDRDGTDDDDDHSDDSSD